MHDLLINGIEILIRSKGYRFNTNHNNADSNSDDADIYNDNSHGTSVENSIVVDDDDDTVESYGDEYEGYGK